MGYGIGGHLALSIQNSVGTATSNWVYIPFVSESLTENIEQLQSENLRAVYDQPNQLEGISNVTGDIVFEPHPNYLGHFLKAVTGNATSTLQTSAYLHEFVPTQSDFDANFALTPYTINLVQKCRLCLSIHRCYDSHTCNRNYCWWNHQCNCNSSC
jgi:hypothetical protein